MLKKRQRYLEDEQKIIYLTPSQPLKYDTNKWVYKTLPTLEQWHQDIAQQFKLHKQQSSNHLAFTFPENESLNQTWLSEIKNEGFQLGILELYIIEGTELVRFKRRPDITIGRVDANNIEDYLAIYRSFALPYGEDFANESVNTTRETILNKEDTVSRCVAYLEGKAVGTVDVIETDKTVEIDSFGVLEALPTPRYWYNNTVLYWRNSRETSCYTCSRWRRYCERYVYQTRLYLSKFHLSHR